ncbi:hypothetical protein [Campylobacter lari]|uniref:Uncharacterized protein n=1 Tax=Campylobacter lari TaxID=201 RepID=A0A7U8G2G3_CAMLA|nr:hypothetical protein [Campylobacter lari]EAJ1254833.1 hypothetical protein [Campylobacter lari]MCR2075708.1 hypothetical protein [Campylobacter lari subsp. concheus]MCR2083284.1 hypothetical protein [Campylobacter lari subsp. concheus]MCR2084719.1 hypothetical protein [Campylobacter lari subsp. concheus]
MKKVEFLFCLSGDVFYRKGDVVELNDKEALRLQKRNIVKILIEQEQVDEQVDEAQQKQKGKGKK